MKKTIGTALLLVLPALAAPRGQRDYSPTGYPNNDRPVIGSIYKQPEVRTPLDIRRDGEGHVREVRIRESRHRHDRDERDFRWYGGWER